MPERYRGKKKQTRMKIMHNAKVLFEANGLYNVTIEQISEASDICRSTFFNHFANMDELLIGIAQQEMIDITSSFKEDGLQGAETVRKVLFKLIDDTVPYPYLIMQLIFTLILKQENDATVTTIWSLIKDNVSIAIANKDVGYTPDELTSMLTGNYFGSVFSYFVKNKPVDGDEIKSNINKIINDFMA